VRIIIGVYEGVKKLARDLVKVEDAKESREEGEKH